MKSTEQVLREQIVDLERLLELRQARIMELEQLLKSPVLTMSDGSKQCFRFCTSDSVECTCKK
jgi:hypothetical protein